MSTKPFWMVVGDVGGEAVKRHLSAGEARAEAERLARKHKGTRFYVLRAVGSVVSEGVEWSDIPQHDGPMFRDDDLTRALSRAEGSLARGLVWAGRP